LFTPPLRCTCSPHHSAALVHPTRSKTWITLLSNLIGEALQFDNFEDLDNVTLANLGKILLVVYLLLGTVLLLNLLIAILTDNFRRISENILSEYTFGFSQLVQRITRRVPLAHPPLNLAQPLFFFVGSRQQRLTEGYEVEALVSRVKCEDDDGNDARIQWENAVVVSCGGLDEFGLEGQYSSIGGLATSNWDYLQYIVRFDDEEVQQDYVSSFRGQHTSAVPVPVRGRKGHPFPLLLRYGQEEVRYLLDLLGTWPVLFGCVCGYWFAISPLMTVIATYQVIIAVKNEVNIIVSCILSPILAAFTLVFIVVVSVFVVVFLVFLWLIQLAVCVVNVMKGGLVNPHVRVQVRRGDYNRVNNDIGTRSARYGEVEHGKAGKKRHPCTYLKREQMKDVLSTTVQAKTIRQLDEKTEKALRDIHEKAKDVYQEVHETHQQMEDMEDRIWEGIERQGRDLRKILKLLSAEQAQANPQNTGRRGGVTDKAIKKALESKDLQKMLKQVEKDEYHRRFSAKMSISARKSSRVAC
jgi:hypothetical protein